MFKKMKLRALAFFSLLMMLSLNAMAVDPVLIMGFDLESIKAALVLAAAAAVAILVVILGYHASVMVFKLVKSLFKTA